MSKRKELRRFLRCALVIGAISFGVVIATGACTPSNYSEKQSAVVLDAIALNDAGLAIDADPGSDAGAGPDAAIDAGPANDATPDPDAQSDSGVSVDAPSGTDSGVPLDTPGQDSGSGNDGGPGGGGRPGFDDPDPDMTSFYACSGGTAGGSIPFGVAMLLGLRRRRRR